MRNTNGYGSIDEDTVEFAISVFDKYQKMGIGTALMNRMLEHLKEMNYPKASLAVQKKTTLSECTRKSALKSPAKTSRNIL